jgi:glucokinase
MQHPSFIAIVGDIGGTNARLQLFLFHRSSSDAVWSIDLIFRQTYRTNRFPGLTALLHELLDETASHCQEEHVHRALTARK